MSAQATNNAAGEAVGAGASAGAAASPQKPFQTKLVLLGEAAVGKSSVVLRFVQNDFQENKEPTIGAAFLTVSMSVSSIVGMPSGHTGSSHIFLVLVLP